MRPSSPEASLLADRASGRCGAMRAMRCGPRFFPLYKTTASPRAIHFLLLRHPSSDIMRVCLLLESVSFYGRHSAQLFFFFYTLTFAHLAFLPCCKSVCLQSWDKQCSVKRPLKYFLSTVLLVLSIPSQSSPMHLAPCLIHVTARTALKKENNLKQISHPPQVVHKREVRDRPPESPMTTVLTGIPLSHASSLRDHPPPPRDPNQRQQKASLTNHVVQAPQRVTPQHATKHA